MSPSWCLSAPSRRARHRVRLDITPNNQVGALLHGTELEIDRQSFDITYLIAEGAFGNVYKGEMRLQGGIRSVTIKIPIGKICLWTHNFL